MRSFNEAPPCSEASAATPRPVETGRRSGPPPGGPGAGRARPDAAAAAGVPPDIPGFLVVGPQRTGTTWVHRYLEARGDVGLPWFVKETFFFDRYWSRGIPWYAGQFADGRGDGPVGEVAPTYFHSSDAPQRIRDTLGRIPIVVMLRDPVDRTVSLWRHMRRYGMTRSDFAEAVQREPELLETGRYAHHLERWIATFGRERVLVLFHHDLETDPDAFVARLCGHVGLPVLPVPHDLHGHRENESTIPRGRLVAWLGWKTGEVLRAAGAYGIVEIAKRAGLKRWFFGRPGTGTLPVVGDEERQRIRAHFRPEVERLEVMLDVHLVRWK